MYIIGLLQTCNSESQNLLITEITAQMLNNGRKLIVSMSPNIR